MRTIRHRKGLKGIIEAARVQREKLGLPAGNPSIQSQTASKGIISKAIDSVKSIFKKKA